MFKALLALSCFIPLWISVTAVTANATTQTITVSDAWVPFGTEINDIYFNNDDHSAWIEVVTYSTSFPDSPTDVAQLSVPGMTYDASTKQVLLQLNDRTIDCADLEPPTRYRWATYWCPQETVP